MIRTIFIKSILYHVVIIVGVSLTRVSPASNVTLSQVLRRFFPPFRQARRKYGVILAHALPAVTSVLGQARQSEIVVVALRTIARMQDESVHAVFVLVFFGNEGVIIADAYFIRTGAVTVPDRKKETEGFFFFFKVTSQVALEH